MTRLNIERNGWFANPAETPLECPPIYRYDAEGER